jgi:Lon protease-like protein
MELPLFPLHVVLFPGAALPLHIFELRYQAMMERALGSDESFGVVAIRRGREAGGDADIYSVGCRVLIGPTQRGIDGTMDLVVTGGQRFRIKQRLPDDPYPLGEVELIEEPEGDQSKEALAEARAAIAVYRNAIARLRGEEVERPLGVSQHVVDASFALASTLHVDVPEQQRLLEAPDAATRLTMTTELARREAMLLETMGPPLIRPGEGYSPN